MPIGSSTCADHATMAIAQAAAFPIDRAAP
jgi:hypothetical protein